MEKLLTLKEAANILSVHFVTLRRMIVAGRIKAVRVGNSWRLRPSDIEEYLKEGEQR